MPLSSPLHADIDGRSFYASLTDPDDTFNRVEITLSHLFRTSTSILGGENYSDRLFRFLQDRHMLRSQVVEIGGGLGDVARNALARSSEYGISSYVLYDISPSLLGRQKQRLSSAKTSFVLDDCLSISRHFARYQGIVLSNGMIADLRSIYLDATCTIDDYGVQDAELRDFARLLTEGSPGFYFHIGSLLLLRELSTLLSPPGTAAILEYDASKLNQPSWFDNHFECGIDFLQLSAYARRLDLAVDVHGIDEILGIPAGQRFITIDMFTRSARLAREVPSIVDLWRSGISVPVLAYTEEAFASELECPRYGLNEQRRLRLLRDLKPYFFSLHDPRFDSKNPKTWSYKCLVLRKLPPGDWRAAAEPFMVDCLKTIDGLPSTEAVNRWRESSDRASMGSLLDTGITLWDIVVAGVIYDLVKTFGTTVWIYFLEERLRKLKVDGSPRGLAAHLATIRRMASDWLRRLRMRNE